MEFNKSKVYTALNADESLIGAKGYFAESLNGLMKMIFDDKQCHFEHEPFFHRVKEITDTFILADNCNGVHFNFFYLAEPAPKKWYVRQSKITGNYLEPNEWSVDSNSAPCVFSGTKEECENWISEHSNPKYRPFKDCDELISYFCQKYSISKTDWGMPFIWVKYKNNSDKYLIIAMTDNVVVLYTDGQTFDVQELFEQYTFLDGSVCGVEE